jgi:hypothetical protein
VNPHYEGLGPAEKVVGRKITALELRDDVLQVTLEGAALALADMGQDCCEERYMRTDDDLQSFVGATLFGVEVRAAPSIETGETRGDPCHDVEFLVVHTDRGDLTMSSHNEHNGFYEGFMVEAHVELAPVQS